MSKATLTNQLSLWEDFFRSAIWLEMQTELTARYELIVAKLIQGHDELWTDDNMRGRLNELEYLKTFPEAIIADIKVQLINHKEKEDDRAEPDTD